MNLLVFDEREWGQSLSLHDERSKHIIQILKLQRGDPFRVGLLSQGLGTAVFRGVFSNILEIDFPALESLKPSAPAMPVCLILGHPRPPVMQRLLKDLNSLGLDALLATASELSEKSYLKSSLWEAEGPKQYLLQGCQQGSTVHLTKLDRAWSLKDALRKSQAEGFSVQGFTHKILFDINVESEAQAELFLHFCRDLEPAWTSATNALAGQTFSPPRFLCALGPERGWSVAEREIFKQEGFETFSLGPRILRTEAAAVLTMGMLGMIWNPGL